MNKIKNLLSGLIFMSLILSACSYTAQVPVDKTSTIPHLTIGQTPSFIMTPTLTKIDLLTDTQPSEEFRLDGTIVFYDVINEKILAISSSPVISSEIPISGKFPSQLIGFTPNGEWLANIPSSMVIDLLSFDKRYMETKMEISGFYSQTQGTATLSGWINLDWINDNLIMASVGYRPSSQLKNPDPIDPTLAVFDPFLGRWRNDLLTGLPSRDRHGGVAISPDLTRTLYLFDEDNGKSVLGLYDQEKNIIIWKNQLFYDPNLVMFGNKNGMDYTEWSPDSSIVAYAGAEDPTKNIPDQSGVYLLDRSAKENHLITKFTNYYKHFRSYGFRWSKDNRLLAFIVFHADDKDETQTIFVYDTQSGQYILEFPIHSEEHILLYWAPDNQHFVYSYASASPMFVVDIKTGLSVLLAEGAVVGGWSDKFPTTWP